MLSNCKCYLTWLIIIIVNTIRSGEAAATNTSPSVGVQLMEKPEWLKVCKLQAPNENNCFKEMFENMFPIIAGGIPSLKIDPFEPLLIEAVNISRGEGSLMLAGGFYNLNIKGASNTTVKKASLNLEKRELSFELAIPRLKIDAIYNLKGNILLLPLVGSGPVKMILKDIATTVTTRISVAKLPEDAINIEEMKVDFNVGGMRIHLDNLFNGNKVLAASLNMFLNQNSKEIIDELKTDLENGLADIFLVLWNTLFNKLPLKYWLV